MEINLQIIEIVSMSFLFFKYNYIGYLFKVIP